MQEEAIEPLLDGSHVVLLAPETYISWLGRTVALWHGDVSQPRRKKILRDRPAVLLTTPESLQAMLVSAHVDHRAFFSGLQAIVVDEVHALRETTEDGTCQPYSNACSGSWADQSNVSGSPLQ